MLGKRWKGGMQWAANGFSSFFHAKMRNHSLVWDSVRQDSGFVARNAGVAGRIVRFSGGWVG